MNRIFHDNETDWTAQLVEQRSGNLKMRVQISLKSTFLVDFSSVGLS